MLASQVFLDLLDCLGRNGDAGQLDSGQLHQGGKGVGEGLFRDLLFGNDQIPQRAVALLGSLDAVVDLRLREDTGLLQ